MVLYGEIYVQIPDSRSARETVHKTSVLPTVGYGSGAWDPYYEKGIQKLERVQRNAVRLELL